MAVDQLGRSNSRRPVILLAVAALLIVVGLASAISAPGAPPRSNKADAYGTPLPTKPTNPQSVNQCNKYYGPANQLSDARDCRALAKRNVGLQKCSKKKGAAKTKCQKAVKKQYAKDKAAVSKQRKAENACRATYQQAVNGLDPEAPDYNDKLNAAGTAFNNCMKRAQG
jgi:hypothetical protein